MIQNVTADVIKTTVKNVVCLLDGDLAEVGVSVGDSAEIICKEKGNRTLYLFDTFAGHPKNKIGIYDIGQTPGKHAADLDDVKKRLNYPNVYLYKGVFPETSEAIKDKSFCFVNIDTDLYSGTYESLTFFVPRMVPGGVILIHDFPGIAGVVCAVVDFFGKNKTWLKSREMLGGTNQCRLLF